MKKYGLLLCIVFVVSAPAWAAWGPCQITDLVVSPSPPTSTGEVWAEVTFKAPAGSKFTDNLQKLGAGNEMNLTIQVYCTNASSQDTFSFEVLLGTNMKPGSYMLNTTLWSHSNATSSGILNLIINRTQLGGVQHTQFQVASVPAV
jgi:hypothetical protein